MPPRCLHGYRSDCGFGMQARAWWFDDSASLADEVTVVGQTFNGAAPLGLRNTSTTVGDELVYESSLEIDSIDLMLTYPLAVSCVSLDLGVGARYARVEQGYFHSEDPLANDLIDSIESRSEFEGIGPSFSLEARWDMCPVAFFAITRYSLLVGESTQDATSIADNVIISVRSQENDDLRPIAELEVGGEYSRPMGCFEAYVQAAFVAQVWQGAGNSANNESIIVLVDPEVSDKDADLGLYGLRLEAGVRY